MNRYTYRAEWCTDYDMYLGSCLEFPNIRERAPQAHKAIAAAAKAVDRQLENLRDDGLEAPQSLSDHYYSGTFVVRTSRALHARLAIESAEQRVSMNQWVAQQLSGRQPKNQFGELFFD